MPWPPRRVAKGVHCNPAAGYFCLSDSKADGTIWNVDLDEIAFLDERDQTTFGRLR